jgi:hypothetical protein
MNNTELFDNCKQCGQSLDDGHECPTPRYDEDEILQMLNDCTNERRINHLNDWERSFTSTCYRMVDKRIMLSQKQRDTLDSLWERVTANG